jgi:hypothetical protein
LPALAGNETSCCDTVNDSSNGRPIHAGSETSVGVNDVLNGLLYASVAAGSLLILLSTAMTGRKLADLEYQQARGINGIRRIQAWTNVRTHAMRVVIGTSFVLIASLLLGNAPEPWRMWSNRLIFALLPAAYVGCSVMDWRAERKQMNLLIIEDEAAHAVAVHADRADRESYHQMATEAIATLERVAGHTAAADAVPDLAPVVPEHHSLSTEQQVETARIATLRARLVAAKLEMGVPPETSEHVLEQPPTEPPA